MAHKDYVSRGRSPKTPPPKAPVPWLRIIVTLALILAFAYFLWSIRNSAQEQPQAPTSVQSEPQEALPEPPQEEWEFVETLPQQTVEVELPDEVESDVRWLMQCGSFRSDDQAEQMRAKIAFQGLESQIRPSEGANGRWYRVILGPYDRKRAAERDRHAIQKTGITTCQIWNWNLD
ncbi:SPOR domain-containing protein [Lacimicrobium sp. SS2-24]|uniref:SPOR domain-containing protein n=1 Tax=Lacimicrobium sp. SS2-24 TaxID=2005569 RepID=UPI000B4BB57D|nr:SPOR domain-containing protein [Lacimicrobium sp. SS2-24]